MRVALLLLLLTACSSWTPDDAAGLTGGVQERLSRRSGTVRFDVDVPEGATELLFTAQVAYPYAAYVVSLTAPHGERVYDAETVWSSPYSVTGAIAPQWAVSLNYPSLDADPPLVAGRYRVVVGVVEPGDANNFRGGVPVRASYYTKADPVVGGRLQANLLYAGGAENADWVAAVDAAVREWTSLYAQAGITLEVREDVVDVGELRAPGRGSAALYQQLSAAQPFRSVNVVLVPDILDEVGLYGIAGGIPGPLAPSAQSAVTVSLLVNAGPDATYSADERRLLGETLAHEVGHYLGLFHPVETSWAAWDSLDDTPECARESACNAALGANLMYPYPLCDAQGRCAPQPELTAQQGAVANRYVGVW